MTGIQVDWYTDACWCDWYTVRLVYLILRYTGGLVYWYFCEPLFTLPLINFVHILLSYTPLFITLWSLFCLYQASPFQFVYNFKSLFVYSFVTFFLVYTSHQCPRGGERLAGRYSVVERLRRLLRLSRLWVRGRLVGAPRDG